MLRLAGMSNETRCPVYEICWPSGEVSAGLTPRDMDHLGEDLSPLEVLEDVRKKTPSGWREAKVTQDTAMSAELRNSRGEELSCRKRYGDGFRFLRVKKTDVEVSVPGVFHGDCDREIMVPGWDVLVDWAGDVGWHSLACPAALEDAREVYGGDAKWDDDSGLKGRICQDFWEASGLWKLAQDSCLTKMEYDRRHVFSVDYDICCAVG